MTINKRVIFLTSILVGLSFLIILSPSAVNLEKIQAEPQTKEIELSNPNKAVPQYPFKEGERLKYGIYSAGIKVGSAVISYLGERVIDGKLLSCITVEASAPGFRDFETIYGDIENSLPTRIEREIRLFGKDVNITEQYNHEMNEVVITRVSKKTASQIIKSEESFNNIILLLYHFRYKRDYKVGDRLEFNLPTKRLEMLIDRETTIKVPTGRYKAVYIRSIPPSFKAWFRKNSDGIPVRIQGAIGFGNTYLALLGVEQ